jgi:hypothetical protein
MSTTRNQYPSRLGGPAIVCVHVSALQDLIPLIFYQSWLYRRSLVVDGNFSLEHMRMKKGENDVFLSDGEGYMVQSLPYQEHLTSSLETPQVYPCWIYTFYLIMLSACHMCQPQSCESGKLKQEES